MNTLLSSQAGSLARFRQLLEDREGGLPQPLWQRLEELRTLLRRTDGARLAARCGARLQADTLYLDAWQRPAQIALADFIARDEASGAPLDPFSQVLLAYYLATADGVPLAGTWISFSELPDGLFYVQAFQSYTGRRLEVSFGNEDAAFERAARAAGGRPVIFGDCAFTFRVFPRVTLLAVCWLGDEDFPPSYRLLFDAHASHYLTTDGCAVLGSVLTRRLLRAACD